MNRVPLFLDYYDSPAQLADFIKNSPVKNIEAQEYNHSCNDNDYRFLKEGEDRKIAEFNELLSALEHLDSNYKKVYNVYGSKIDMSKAMTGNPKSMVSISKRNSKSRQINLIIDMTMYSKVSNGTIKDIGEKMLAFIERFSMEGNQVGLYASCSACRRNQQINMMLCKLKSAGEPLELMKVTYPLSNPFFLRHVFFEWHKTDENIHIYSGLGQPCESFYTINEMSIAISRELGQKAVFIPFGRYTNSSLRNELYDDIKKHIDVIDKTVYF